MKKRFATMITTGALLLATATQVSAAEAPVGIQIRKSTAAVTGERTFITKEVNNIDAADGKILHIRGLDGVEADDEAEFFVTLSQPALSDMDYESFINDLHLTAEEKQTLLDVHEKTKPLYAQIEDIMERILNADEDETAVLSSQMDAIMQEIDEISDGAKEIMESAGLFIATTVTVDEAGKVFVNGVEDTTIAIAAINYEDYVQSLDISDDEKAELVDIHNQMTSIWDEMDQEGMNKEDIDQYLFEIEALLQRQMEILGESGEFSVAVDTFDSGEGSPEIFAFYSIELAD